MKRKVIQIANSTQLISLPRTWTKKHNIIKGQEVNVEEVGENVVVSTESVPKLQTAEIDIGSFDDIIKRYVYALYQKGIDEIKISFSKPQSADKIREAIGTHKGLEILDQTSKYIILKNIWGNIEEFDLILKRCFHTLITMADQMLEALRQGDSDALKMAVLMEESNDILTMMCRRILNKGHESSPRVGPLYTITVELERLADQYKHSSQYLLKVKNEIKIRKDVLNIFEKTNNALRTYYNLFYKFENEGVTKLKNETLGIIDESIKALNLKNITPQETILLFNCVDVCDRLFGSVGNIIILNV